MELTADQPGPHPGLQEEVERSTKLLISSDVLTADVTDKCQTDPKRKDCDSVDRSDSFWVTSACSEKSHFSLHDKSESTSAQHKTPQGFKGCFPSETSLVAPWPRGSVS